MGAGGGGGWVEGVRVRPYSGVKPTGCHGNRHIVCQLSADSYSPGNFIFFASLAYVLVLPKHKIYRPLFLLFITYFSARNKLLKMLSEDEDSKLLTS